MKRNTLFRNIIVTAVIMFCAFSFLARPRLTVASSISVDNVYNEVNQTRIQNSQLVLRKNNLLTLAAQRKAQDMLTYGYWAHINPVTGATPWKFILGTGYRGKFAGENLAKDFGDTQTLISTWIASPTHKQNLLSSRFQETGIAVATGIVSGQSRTIVVQMFGEPRK